jgi:hypothetical protein
VTQKLPSHAKKIVITVSTRLPLIGFSSPAIKNPAETKSAGIKVILDSLHAFYGNLTLFSLRIKLRHPARFCHPEPGRIVCVSTNPERSAKRAFGVASSFCFYLLIGYFGITSRASLLDTNSLISLLFFPASIIASREP